MWYDILAITLFALFSALIFIYFYRKEYNYKKNLFLKIIREIEVKVLTYIEEKEEVRFSEIENFIKNISVKGIPSEYIMKLLKEYNLALRVLKRLAALNRIYRKGENFYIKR